MLRLVSTNRTVEASNSEDYRSSGDGESGVQHGVAPSDVCLNSTAIVAVGPERVNGLDA